ncbi:hypothetical protein Asp14428_48840 [Actinoplanes sp. NBRC 14428]|uniref:Uncharacterized protein n=1 Tax=Pseudosporangium ferrugineum TaxID=439699 RepID=A0A2T0RDF8_9ACTN|nr:hypothetical protein CLV70_13818 [Pseudosporangium ferrugineum]BCJ53409.1 hypothetical protein Asp14428_48840 [Actinoplanes sp. NBRC 14428]
MAPTATREPLVREGSALTRYPGRLTSWPPHALAMIGKLANNQARSRYPVPAKVGGRPIPQFRPA